jgi:hypothetical protein
MFDVNVYVIKFRNFATAVNSGLHSENFQILEIYRPASRNYEIRLSLECLVIIFHAIYTVLHGEFWTSQEVICNLRVAELGGPRVKSSGVKLRKLKFWVFWRWHIACRESSSVHGSSSQTKTPTMFRRLDLPPSSSGEWKGDPTLSALQKGLVSVHGNWKSNAAGAEVIGSDSMIACVLCSS